MGDFRQLTAVAHELLSESSTPPAAEILCDCCALFSGADFSMAADPVRVAEHVTG